jgi:hypothetical protein
MINDPACHTGSELGASFFHEGSKAFDLLKTPILFSRFRFTFFSRDRNLAKPSVYVYVVAYRRAFKSSLLVNEDGLYYHQFSILRKKKKKEKSKAFACVCIFLFVECIPNQFKKKKKRNVDNQ